MNQRIKQIWIDALRSEKYKQGKGKLRNINNEFCCLGVLCDILKEELNLDWKLYDGLYTFDDLNTTLTSSIMIYCGLDYNYTNNLMGLNDNGSSFKSIANYIEDNE